MSHYALFVYLFFGTKPFNYIESMLYLKYQVNVDYSLINYNENTMNIYMVNYTNEPKSENEHQ